MFAGLSLDQAPPFRAPLKFFLTAPLFAILAALFAIFSDNYFIHSPNLIANIHLLTIGFILLSIFGALQQMLPVVATAIIPKPKLVANLTYSLITLGLISFVMGFVLYSRIFFDIAAIGLFLGVIIFLSVALNSLRKVQNKSYIVKGMIVSLVLLFVAIFIGTHLIISYATGNFSLYHTQFALLHYNFIFFGGLFLLIASITFQVVPMFWVAKDFDKTTQKYTIYGIVISLLFLVINTFLELNLYIVYKILVSTIVLYFSYSTFITLKNRKRKLTDYSVYFYYSSIIFLTLGIIYWLTMEIFDLKLEPLIVLFGLGFTISLINGMMYKIIPFLTWFHLNAQGVFNIPTMRDMIPTKLTKIQFYLHISLVVIFFIGFFFDVNIIIKFASSILLLSNIILFINLAKSSNIFLKNDKLQK